MSNNTAAPSPMNAMGSAMGMAQETEMAMADMPMPGMGMAAMNTGGMSMADMPMSPGHMALMALVPPGSATHVAVNSGSWFDPSTWANGQVPGDDAKVLIGAGVQVRYDGQSDARLKTLRVDGRLSFATDADTKLVVDTFVNAMSGELVMGTDADPIQADVSTEIIFTSEGDIDKSWDPKQLSRGLVSHGKVSIHGAEKTDLITLQSEALAGDSELVLSEVPMGWQVGDKLVLGGTNHRWGGDDADNSRFQDEELTITAINGNRVSFINQNVNEGDNTVLRFDHQAPEGFEDELNLYVANTTQNISFQTENADAIANDQRAHIMFMHNPDVVVKNAGFYNLGRSDKNKLVDDTSTNKDGRDGNGTNPRGRYALHFHRTGADSWDGQAAIAQGNAVVGSPGWGIVHHDSYANVEDNVVFDVVGAGIVAEAGNEIGTWRNNITIKTTGDDEPGAGLGFQDERVENFDYGFNGEGYWVQGAAQIAIVDNVAISAAGGGINFFGGGDGGETVRDKKKIAVANLPAELQDIAKGTDDETRVDVSAVPLLKVSGFEAYNALEGISSWSRLRNKDGQLTLQFDSEGEERPAHDYRSTIENFKVWNLYGNGVRFVYSGNTDLKNGLILGRNAYGSGVATNHASTKQRFDGIQVEGFKQGIKTPLDVSVEFVGSVLENSILRNNEVNFAPTKDFQFETGAQPEDFSEYFQIGDGNQIEADADNVAPTAQFSEAAIGGLAVELDARASYDGDSDLRGKASNGIVSYGWDLDNDGRIDRYGRQIDQRFAQAGDYRIGLTVWDEQGASTTTQQTISVAPTSWKNPFQDSSFADAGAVLEGWQSDSSYSDRGWFTTEEAQFATTDGKNHLRLSKGDRWTAGVGQIVRDNGICEGVQTLSLDVKNIEGDSRPWLLNQVDVRLWGVNGQFDNQLWEATGPTVVGLLPMESSVLLDTTLGGESFDWTNFSWEVDLGQGFDHLLFQVNTQATADRGDYVAIDNLRLLGEAGASAATVPTPPVTPAPVPLLPPAPPDVPAPVSAEPTVPPSGPAQPIPAPAQPLPTSLEVVADGIIDLRQVDFDGDGQVDQRVSVTLSEIQSDTGYDNSVGFYEVADASGAILDQVTGQLLSVEAENYAEVALRQRLAGMELRRDTLSLSFEAEGGTMLGSFLVADYTIAEAIAFNPTNADWGIHTYFTQPGSNPDGVNHLRMLGQNHFSFEDLWMGGDKDFDDLTFRANVGAIAA